MKVSCKWCGGIHPRGYSCPARPARHRQDTRQTKVRNSYQWQKVRRAAWERDHGLCRLCLAEGRITTTNLQGHHIIPLEESLTHAYDVDWVITLCSGAENTCHERAERGEIARERLHRLAIEPIRMPKAQGTPLGV